MSRDGTYILKYDSQAYIKPTPMELDKETILEQNPNVEFLDLDNHWIIYFEMPKYTLLLETVKKLKADQVFESCDGDDFVQIKEVK